MNVSFRNPDNYSQLKNLQRLLTTPKPTENDVVRAMLLISIILYKNRPGKLYNLPNYSIHGTGCHNPTSEKNDKIVLGVWRTEVYADYNSYPELKNISLTVKHELYNGGFLKASFSCNGRNRTISADIFYGTKDAVIVRNIFINTGGHSRLMNDLNHFMRRPLQHLISA